LPCLNLKQESRYK